MSGRRSARGRGGSGGGVPVSPSDSRGQESIRRLASSPASGSSSTSASCSSPGRAEQSAEDGLHRPLSTREGDTRHAVREGDNNGSNSNRAQSRRYRLVESQ